MRTHISFVLDESGSMSPQQGAVIENINTFLAEQRRVDQPCTVSILSFNTGFKTLARMQTLKDIKNLSFQTYRPDGGTALRQALIQEIDQTGRDLAAIPAAYRPEKVIFVTVTDGEENSSSMWHTAEALKQRIDQQSETYKWEFVYLGANQDAFQTGAQYGFQPSYTANYVNTVEGLRAVYATMSQTVGATRSGLRRSVAFTAEEQNNIAHPSGVTGPLDTSSGTTTVTSGTNTVTSRSGA